MAALAAEPVPARVVEAYDQMMRQLIGPALRQLGFRGTVREFKYGDRSQSGTVRWQEASPVQACPLLAAEQGRLPRGHPVASTRIATSPWVSLAWR
jgi:hypothetical protein